MAFGEFLLNALSPVLEAATTEQVTGLLDKLALSDTEAHKSAVQGLAIGLKHLDKLVDKTKTKIDNSIVDGLFAAVQASAEKYGVELPS